MTNNYKIFELKGLNVEERQVKSGLQMKLEAEGWRLLTNVHTIIELLGVELRERGTPLRDEEIRMQYLGRGYPEVHVDVAHNTYGEPLPNIRAVYVRGEKPENSKFNGYGFQPSTGLC